MPAISLWAKHHKWATRLLFVFVLYPLLNLAGFLLGDLLQSQNIVFSGGWYYWLCLIIVLLLAFYPSRKVSFYYRKCFDISLALASFCMIALTANRSMTAPVTVPFTNHVNAAASDPGKITKTEKKSLRKFVQKLRMKYRKADGATKAILIILSILVAAGLLYLLGMLACGIACNGAEALAWVILIVGGIGIIASLVAVIKSISRKYGKPRIVEE